jgi:hypothetical protein
MWWRRRAEVHGRKLFWLLAGITNSAMLASWSYLGIEADQGLRVVLGVALAIACVMLSLTLITALSARWRTRVAPALVWERTHFQCVFVIAVLWYVVFAVAARFTLVPAHAPLLPVPLSLAIAGAVLGVGTLIWRMRAGRNGSAVVAYLMNELRPVFYSGRQLGEIISLPVLGIVSMTGIERHLSQERRALWAYSAATAALVLVAVVALVVQSPTSHFIHALMA